MIKLSDAVSNELNRLLLEQFTENFKAIDNTVPNAIQIEDAWDNAVDELQREIFLNVQLPDEISANS
jgi:hypothetical protein